LVVQSLALDTKLHTLFDKMCHKGKNVMDYKVSQLDSSLEADTALSDMLVSEEEDVNNSYSDQMKLTVLVMLKLKEMRVATMMTPWRTTMILTGRTTMTQSMMLNTLRRMMTTMSTWRHMTLKTQMKVVSKRANRPESCTLSMDGPSEDTLMEYVLWVILVSFAHHFRGYIFPEILL